MFLEFYGLLEQPFGVTPDPTYLFLTRSHQEALASLSSGIRADRGFLALIAEPGMGKTTLLYQLEQELGDSARTVYLFLTQCNSREVLRYILNELSIDTQGMDLFAMHAQLNAVLFDEMLAGKRFVLVVDEAQNLDESVLESIRLLSNFETHHAKLLQIVLAGQPGLAAKLEKPELSQLRQRLTVLSRLTPLTVAETACYVEHRLKVAGYWGEPLFPPNALELIAKQSKGIPRIINNICYDSLSLAHARGLKTATSEIVLEALTRLGIVASQSSGVAEPESVSPALPAPRSVQRSEHLASTAASAGAAAVSRQPTAAQLTYKSRGRFKLTRWIYGAVALPSLLLLWSVNRRPIPSPVAKLPQKTLIPTTSNDSGKSLATSQSQPANPLGSTSASYAADPQDTDSGQVLTVVAGPQQTLKEISLVYLGHFDQQLFAEICSLNPELKDPNHIQGGQLIRLPLLPHTLTKAIDTSEPTRAANNNEAPEGLFRRVVALLHGKVMR